MSTHVVGIRLPDDDWKKMKAVWDACKAAGIGAPPEVYAFFNGIPPDDEGVLVDVEVATREWSAEMEAGLVVDLSQLPAGVKILRFC